MPAQDRGKPITKRDLIAYYATVAPWMTMGLAGHPVNLNRFPDGIEGAKGGFYHKAVPAHAPAWVRRWPNPRASDRRDARVPPDRRRPGARVGGQLRRLRDPPVDVDGGVAGRAVLRPRRHRPGTETTWDETLTIARLYRVAIDKLDLVARPKVTGKRGIQIYIPVKPGYTSARPRRSSRRCRGPSAASCASWSAGSGRRATAAARPGSTTRRTR